MVDQVLTPEETPTTETPFFGEEGEGLLSKQMQGPRQGASFEERALQQIRGTGPHVTRSGKVDQLIGTAGRMNQLTHGQQGPGATSGEAQRNQLLGARAARQDPYRDQMHYREDFGTAMTDTVHGQATEQQKAFKQHIASTNKQLDQYAQEVVQDRSRIKTEYDKGVASVNQSYQEALKKIPEQKSLSQSYDDWLKTDNHKVWVHSGSNPDNPGNEEATYQLTPDQLKPFFELLAKEAGVPVINNRIYLGNKGVGQDVHDQLRNTMKRNKIDYYEQAAPALAEQNKQIAAAKTNLATQRNEALNNWQTQYSNASADLAKAEGTIQGRRQGLVLEQQANAKDLAEVRTNYQNRLKSIDEALAAMVGGGTAASRSEGQVRQITPRMVEQQQG